MVGNVVLAQRGPRVGVGFGDAGAHGGEAFGAELFRGLPGVQCLADDFAVGGVASFLDLGADEPGHVGGKVMVMRSKVGMGAPRRWRDGV